MLDTRTCAYEKCRREFIPKRKDQDYCSPDCRQDAYYSRLPVCPVCSRRIPRHKLEELVKEVLPQGQSTADADSHES